MQPKKRLLETSDPIYAKRLIRELNKALRAGKDVYALSSPFNVKVISVAGCKTSARIIVLKADCRFESNHLSQPFS